MSDYDILTKWLKYSEDEAQKMLARLKIQKLEELKLTIIAQNPSLLGVGLPGPNEQQVGTEPGGPSPMLGPDMGGAPPMGGQAGGPMGAPPMGGQPNPLGLPDMGGGPMGMRKYMGDEDAQDMQQGPQGPPPAPNSGAAIPEPNIEDIRKYNLEIQDFASEMDEPELDRSQEE
jgi:hypothetical protein